MKKMTVLCFVITCGLLTGSAVADETYTCTNGSQERIISVVYQDQVAQVPCEVQYTKDGVTETLWSARNIAGYCQEKATAFVEKQRGWGWACESAGEAMSDDDMQEAMKEEGN